MSNQVSFGSIVVVDYTDLSEFTTYPMSNLPLTVASDPNTNTYTPNWSENNLTITPVCYYGGSSVTPNSVTWTVQKNVADPVAVSSDNGENVSGNNLIVSKNRFSEASTDMITYYCESSFVEPETKSTLVAKGQITFSLIKHASNVKTCNITGENVFKYNTSGVLQGSDTITLSGTVANVSISKWQYKNTSGTWSDYPIGTITGSTLNVSASHNVFVNDVATIRLTTSDSSVFDVFGIYKLRDGAAGVDTVSAVLTNENQMIPCDANNNPLDYTAATTKITLYEGGNDVTSSWTITAEAQTAGISFNNSALNASNNYSLTVTDISVNSANIVITCRKTGYAPIVKIFSLVKSKMGADGITPTVYSVEPSTLAINRDIANAYTPTSVTFRAYAQTGESKTAYNGVFKIYINDSTTSVYTSSSNESSYIYTPTGNTVKTIKCELYAAGGGGTPVDSQTVVIVGDGKTGATGNGITSTTIRYQAGTSGTVAPNDETKWTEAVPSVSEGHYLWTRTVNTYTDGSTTTSYSVSRTGVNGTSVSISSTSITYAKSTNGTTAPESGWEETIPTLNGNEYLWTKTVVNYSNGSSTTSYSVGAIGADGVSASNVVVGNYADVIPCTSDGKALQQYVVTIPFRGYTGTTQKYTTATITGGTIYGTSTSSAINAVITNSTSTSEGTVKFTIPANALIGNDASVKTGEVSIRYDVTAGTSSAGIVVTSITQKYTWTKSNLAVNGTNAIVLDIYSANGYIIQNEENNITMTARLINGASVQTSGVTYQWYQYKSSSSASDKYDAISNSTASTCTVTPSMVDGYASFKCIATYGGKTYSAYFSVLDKQDDLQTFTFCTIGEQLRNGQGVGAIYARVYQKGVEVDPLPMIVKNLSEASGETKCYLIDQSNKTILYKTRTSTSSSTWTTSTPALKCTYVWTFRDKDGNTCNYNGQGVINGQVIYIDGSLVDKKVIFDLEVTK